MGRGFPDPALFDSQLLSELAAKAVSTAPEVALQYASNRGLASLRQTLRDLIADTQGQVPAEDELIVTSGGVDALTLVTTALADPGNAVLVEAPTYLGACAVFTANEAVPVAMCNDDEGLVPASLLDACETARKQGAAPKFAYVIPDFQNPSGLLLSAKRRAELVAAAREAGVIIVEDVAYRDLAFDGAYLPSIYELGPDVTVQVGTFSKTFTPGTRLGWACGPEVIISAIAEVKTTTDQCASALSQCMLNAYISEGHFTAGLPQIRAAYQHRSDGRGHRPAGLSPARVPGLRTAGTVRPSGRGRHGSAGTVPPLNPVRRARRRRHPSPAALRLSGPRRHRRRGR